VRRIVLLAAILLPNLALLLLLRLRAHLGLLGTLQHVGIKVHIFRAALRLLRALALGIGLILQLAQLRVLLDDLVGTLEDAQLVGQRLSLERNIVRLDELLNNVLPVLVDGLPHVLRQRLLRLLDEVVPDQLGHGVTYVADHNGELVIQPRPYLANEHVIRVLLILMDLRLVAHHLVPVVREDLIQLRLHHTLDLQPRLLLLLLQQFDGNVLNVA